MLLYDLLWHSMVLMYGVTACCSCEVCQTPPPSDGYMMVVFIVGWSGGTVHIVEWCCMVLYGGEVGKA